MSVHGAVAEENIELDETALDRGTPGGGSNSPVVNDYTGQGTLDYDPYTRTRLKRKLYDSRDFLETAYAECDLAKKQVDILVEDAMCAGFLLQNTTKERQILQRMMELDMVEKTMQAGKWARAFGDAYLVLNDGMDLGMPIGPYLKYQLQSLDLFTGYELVPDTRFIERRFGAPNFDEPTAYAIVPTMPTQEPMLIHPERVIRFRHLGNPPGGWKQSSQVAFTRPTITRAYCSLSLLQYTLHVIIKELDGLDAVHRYLDQAALLDMEVDKIDEESAPDILSQAATVARTAGSFRVYVHAKDSKLQRIASSFSGLNDILEKNLERVASSGDFPKYRFSGMEPTGLNADGASSMKLYQTKLGYYQRNTIDASWARIMPYIARDVGAAPFSWRWNPYIPKTDKEKLEEEGLRLDNMQKAIAVLDSAKTAGLVTDEQAQQLFLSLIDGNPNIDESRLLA